MKKGVLIALIILVLLAAIAFGYLWYRQNTTPKNILTFKDCSDAGNLVVDTKPRECHTKEGHIYIEEDNHLALEKVIVVSSPKPYIRLKSPFEIKGEARGKWFGNNRLTVKLVDPDHKLIAEKSVFALEDASKPDRMVPFVGALSFQIPEGLERGKILVEKVNTADFGTESGPLVIPVVFK